MELIAVDDVRKQIAELSRLVRIVDPKAHPVLVNGSVRQVDFLLSVDMQYVEVSLDAGLSFATSMKKFKKLLQTKARFHSEVDIYAIDENSLASIDGLRVIHDRPGHASLAVVRRMKLPDLVMRLEAVASKMEKVGTMRVTP